MAEPVIVNISRPGKTPYAGDIVEVQTETSHTRYRWPLASQTNQAKSNSEKRSDAYKRRCDPLLDVVRAYEMEVALYPDGSPEKVEATKKLASSKAYWLAEREAIRKEFP